MSYIGKMKSRAGNCGGVDPFIEGLAVHLLNPTIEAHLLQ